MPLPVRGVQRNYNTAALRVRLGQHVHYESEAGMATALTASPVALEPPTESSGDEVPPVPPAE